MSSDNKFYRHSRISEETFFSIVRCFADDLSATDAARLNGLTRKSATTIYLKLRRRVAQECRRSSPFATGRVGANESHSCTHCVCGRRGCGTANGKPVFTLLTYDDLIYTQIIPDCKKAPLRAVIRGRHVPDEVMRNNGWHGYQGLVDVECARPYAVINEGADRADECEALSLVESFWQFARQRLEKFNGIPNRTFYLHLKECEWRFNRRNSDLQAELFELLKQQPI